MRVLPIVMFALLCLSCRLKSQGSTGGHVKFMIPPAVEQKLVLEFPDASVRWRKEGLHYKAIFVNPRNNMGHVIVYDHTGRVLRREKELERQEYPQTINYYHENKFPAEGFVIWSSVDTAGNLIYYSPRADKTLYFDKNGQILNEKKRTLADSLFSPPR